MNFIGAGLIEDIVRKAGTLFNAAVLAFFIYAAVRLYGYGMASLAEAGGLGGLSWIGRSVADPREAIDQARAFLFVPGGAGRLASYAAAWFSLIGSGGFAWMALLGARWFFHALVRAAMALKG